MPNSTPIFPKTGLIAWATLTTQNQAYDGTGTVSTICTSDATNGTRVDTIKCRALGTNVASVLRVFINNGSTNATAANNSLIYEQTLAASTASQVASTTDVEIPIDIVLPPSYKINVCIGTTVAAGWQVTCFSGSY